MGHARKSRLAVDLLMKRVGGEGSPDKVKEGRHMDVEESRSVLSKLLEHENSCVAPRFVLGVLQPFEGLLDFELHKHGCQRAAGLGHPSCEPSCDELLQARRAGTPEGAGEMGTEGFS